MSLETEPVPNADGTPNPGLLRANVAVEELPKYRLRYGFQLYDPYSPLFDPKWGTVDPGVVADLTRRGLFGRGLTGGIGAGINPVGADRARVHQQPHVLRPAGADQPLPRAEDEKTASAGIVLDSRTQCDHVRPAHPLSPAAPARLRLQLRARKFDFLVQLPTLPVPIPVEVDANIGRLLSSIVLDDRDDVINTRQGPFHSSSFEFGPTALGSTRAFRKYLGQQFYFVPWKQVTLASAARLEVAGGRAAG